MRKRTALLNASERGDAVMVEFLLKRGADATVAGCFEYTDQ